jgi:non-homologous end joining protein Ku
MLVYFDAVLYFQPAVFGYKFICLLIHTLAGMVTVALNRDILRFTR